MKGFFRRYRKRSLGLQRRCERCRKDYIITSIELAFLTQNELPVPKLCRTCLKEIVPVDIHLFSEPAVTKGPDPKIANS